MIDDIWKIAINAAKEAVLHDDVPIGAVLVKDDKIIAISHNTRELYNDIMGHAEINVIKEASKLYNTWNLSGFELYVTLKPCSMCMEVIKQSRINKVYYLLDKLSTKKEYNKTIFEKIEEKNDNINEQMYLQILSSFFRDKR